MDISSAVQLAAISRVSAAGRYKVEHEKRYRISTSKNCVLFCWKNSDHAPKISEDCPRIVRNPFKRFETFLED